jgi:hypothetical protein
MFFCFSFNLLGQYRTVILAIVLAEFDSFADFSLSISDWLSHLKSYCLSNFFEPLLNTISNIFNEFSPLLNSSISMNFIGGGGPLEFNMQVLIANKFKGFLELPCIRVFRYDLSHIL